MAAYIRSVMNNSVSNTVIIEFSKRNESYRKNSIITEFDILLFITDLIQGDSLATGPKLLSIKNYVIEIIT